VNGNGTVLWIPPTKFVSYCDLNLRKWPRDIQNCSIILGSWTYNAEEIDIQIGKDQEEIKTPAELTKKDMEWELLSADAKWRSKKYECCKELYTSVIYEFVMQRRSTIYSYTVILPIIREILLYYLHRTLILIALQFISLNQIHSCIIGDDHNIFIPCTQA